MVNMDELHIQNLQDGWSKLYVYLAKNLIDHHGIEGESALRQGIRKYGIDRGIALRRKHLEYGLKPNLFILFTYGDLPADTRFRRKTVLLNSQQRLAETLACPVAQMWITMDAKKLGRIYCEEFHHACFAAYAPRAQINLAKSLTQDGDDYCQFSFYLRPANMDVEERRNAFEEFDPAYNPPANNYPVVSARDGFEMLAIKLYYNITDTAIDVLGEKVEGTIKQATKQFAIDLGDFLKTKADNVQ